MNLYHQEIWINGYLSKSHSWLIVNLYLFQRMLCGMNLLLLEWFSYISEAKALYTLLGYQHKQSNQFSTYNYYGTNIATFFVTNAFPDSLYLYEYNFNSNQLKLIQAFDNNKYQVYSMSSSQSSSANDLLFSFTLNNHDNYLFGR
ncbi:hypothetical protein DICPUDRAFT_76496 [Dictyostelium purpureum]|uniref:Uncharacterized protein n=1 Tax=Dictyostelium purpureum TaxID=5786 RepID=F0ZDS8_DICPU|nr:uncharacterized protein DICPUDRAFT_76496 [Dictyostelium purpureum]EGC37899.1 hypothetical protein DICPUDRAFT_76496 [Dictyostelium purpureum]|eukprot:XP_003285559.1 hypothetical protein DICPUDRAFT_76496 [Dictyostelium purpureum]